VEARTGEASCRLKEADGNFHARRETAAALCFTQYPALKGDHRNKPLQIYETVWRLSSCGVEKAKARPAPYH